jgi:hypothetical protein
MTSDLALPLLDQPALGSALLRLRPRTDDQLHAFIRAVLGFRVPRRAIVPGHAAPFDYVRHAFFEDSQPRDCVVWANRGGGKTQLGAIVTLLDLLCKPGIQVRILGGSFEQSSKMHGYLKRLLERDGLRGLVRGHFTGRHVELKNGSRVEVLSQSERAVRGQRVHRLRCDEVELFEPEVWRAAQLVTRSAWCGDVFVRASIEALSTMHRPYGLMQQIVGEAGAHRRLFRWGLLDVLERCEELRACGSCALWADCGGRAKAPGGQRGFIAIDDAVQQRARVGDHEWRSEMLCLAPSRSNTVYPEFDTEVHVRSNPLPSGRGLGEGGPVDERECWIGGIDFGYRAPTVLLWAILHSARDVVHVVDELIARETTTDRFIALAKARGEERGWGVPAWTGADPAGHQRSEHTGRSTISLWRDAGWPMRTTPTTIEAGIGAVRRRLKRADGSASLFIHPRCEKLIRALTKYHYPDGRPEASQPVKDGEDHAADALRYMIVNLERGAAPVKVREY